MNVVDSSGWLEVLADGANAGFFEPVLSDVDELLVPTVCLYEVYKRLQQLLGKPAAKAKLGALLMGHVAPLTEEIAFAAATISIENQLSMADSILLATAREYQAVFWTQDAHFAGLEGVRYQAKLAV